MKRHLARTRHWESGRTLAEVIVALALTAIVSIVVVTMLVNAQRWHRMDQKAVVPLEPLRGALDHIGRDARLASEISCCPDNQLILLQQRELHRVQVTYWLDGTHLMRRSETDSRPPQVAERMVIVGLKTFAPERTGDTVTLTLEAESLGPNGTTQQAKVEIAPRLGVMP